MAIQHQYEDKVFCKICKALDCGLDDIMEIIPDEEEERNEL